MHQDSETDPTDEAVTFDKIQVGVSSCLLGEEVRFDGGHKRDAYLTGTLASYFDFVPFCPEAAVGLGIPRQPIRLVRRGASVRAVGVKTPELDPTDQLAAYAETTTGQLSHISGYIFKKASPSCGMERVKVYNEKGMPEQNGVGIYAGVLMQRLPLLPEIYRLFGQFKANYEKSVDVEVVSAFDLADEARDRLAQALGRKLERQVKVRTSTDSELLGGVLIRAGDLVIDGSVRGRLNKLAEALNS